MSRKGILMALVLISAMFAVFPAARSQTTTLKVSYEDPSYPPVNPVTVFNITIEVQDVTSLHGWEAFLRWDPSIVRFLEVYEGPFLRDNAGPNGTDFHYYLSSLGEYIQIYDGIWDSGYSASGSGVLAILKMECYDTGDPFNFTLYDTHLWAEGSIVEIPHNTEPLEFYTTYPVVKFYWTPEFPDINEAVTFNASDSYPYSGRTIQKYTWDFGDGNVTETTDPTIVHIYADYGIYTVNLTVLDDQGDSWFRAKELKIWRDVAALDFWPCPWWYLYELGYEPYLETSVLPGDWLFKGERLYISVSVWNFATVLQNFTIYVYFVDETGTEYLIDWTLGYDLISGELFSVPMEYINQTTYGNSHIIILLDPDIFSGTKVLVPANHNYTGVMRVVAPLDQDPTNDEYEYTIPFHLRVMGDANNDGIADGGDLGILGLNWYTDQPITPPYPDNYCNFSRENGDSLVDGGDLGILGLHWYETE